MKKLILGVACLFIFPVLDVHSQRVNPDIRQSLDPRGEPNLTVCSQNLKMYGKLGRIIQIESSFSEAQLKKKELALVERFLKVGCDVIAVQEVLGSKNKDAHEALGVLAKALAQRSNRTFEYVVGEANEGSLRVGFLVSKDRAQIINKLSYTRVELPTLTEKERPRLFPRAPLEIQIQTKDKEPKIISLVTFHFKAQGKGDPAGLSWETFRMEMAEAVRTIVQSRHERSFVTGEVPLIILGDRNSNFDLASAKILEGVTPLSLYKGTSRCRLGKRGNPLCQVGAVEPPKLHSVLIQDPQTKLLSGTYYYKKTSSWLDDILMPLPSLPYAWLEYDKEGDYDSGVVYEPQEASDHAMVYVRLNWQ